MKKDEKKEASNKELEDLLKEISQMTPKENKNSKKQTTKKTTLDDLIKELEQVNSEIKQSKKPNIGSHRAPEAVLTKLVEQLEQTGKEIKQGTEKNKELPIEKDTKQKNTWQGIKDTLNKFAQKSSSLAKNVVDSANIIEQKVGKTIKKLNNKVNDRGR